MPLIIGISLLLAFLAGWSANLLAHRKGRNPRLWMIASIFLIFPVLVLALLPARHQPA